MRCGKWEVVVRGLGDAVPRVPFDERTPWISRKELTGLRFLRVSAALASASPSFEDERPNLYLRPRMTMPNELWHGGSGGRSTTFPTIKLT